MPTITYLEAIKQGIWEDERTAKGVVRDCFGGGN